MLGSKKIGELLLEGGDVTQAQLRRALSAQRDFGGRLGSRLIQIGAVAADVVAHALASQHGVKPATNAMFMAAGRDALGALHAGICREHTVFPLALDGSTGVLALAMLDPGDLGAVDRLGRTLQLLIDPHAAPEIQICSYLEHHYKVRSTLYEDKRAESGGTKDLATVGRRATRTSDGEYSLDWLSAPAIDEPSEGRGDEIEIDIDLDDL